jgi:uncharacterized protein YdaU (DUF1376 family)
MSQAPSLPLFVDAYLADTTHLSTEEHGAYLLLLMAMWRRGGSVPDDDTDNARMVGLPVRKWRQVRARLSPFLVLGNGEISQKRLRKEWEFVVNRSNAARQNGSLGGRPPSNKNNDIAKPGGLPPLKPDESPQSHTHKIEVANATLSETGVPDAKPKSREKTSYPADFEAFWRLFPTDALMSKKAAGAVWAKMSVDERLAAVESIPAFKAYCAAHKDYRPVHANRYLQQERFVGFNALAGRTASKVFVKKGTGQWDAWQRVKPTPAAKSDATGEMGWWFDAPFPSDFLEAAE